MKGDELICLLRTRDDLCDNEKERWVCERKRMQKLMLYREQDSTHDTTLQDLQHSVTCDKTLQDSDKQNYKTWDKTLQDTRLEIHGHNRTRLVTQEYKRLVTQHYKTREIHGFPRPQDLNSPLCITRTITCITRTITV